MAKRGRSKKSSNWLTVIVLAVVLIAAVAAGIYYASSRAEKDVEGGITGAPEQIELLEESKAAQKAVDDILLTRDNWQLTDNGRVEQCEKQSSGTEVIWNKRELAIGIPAGTELRDAAGWLRDKIEDSGLKLVILTCGTRGSYVVTADTLLFHETPVVDVVDTVGAGDSFTATFCAALLKGHGLEAALDAAVRVSAFVCTRPGAMPELPEELRNLL